ncbi:hypothetical protein QTG54_006585 [Skeletonema marinoi]|uniref:C2H2-type domain-containing protein n=1 Tax=Skeletonema marinoi TaxID=267567 RepID=A0AAD8YB64_9STRA|nr:hypothetical protein QTG54_006585 [Skeletonema marinoi]
MQGIGGNAAQLHYMSSWNSDQALPHHYHFDNTGTKEDGSNPNTEGQSRKQTLKPKSKDGAAGNKAAKKAKTTRFQCIPCNKYFKDGKALEQHKQGARHMKRLQRTDTQRDSNKQSYDTNNHVSSHPHPSEQQQHGISNQAQIRDDSYAQPGTVNNWNANNDNMSNTGFDASDMTAGFFTQIAEANRAWSRANLQGVGFQGSGLQPDECISTSQAFHSDAYQTPALVTNTGTFTQNIDDAPEVKTEEDCDNNSNSQNTDVSKSNGNLMKLTAEQSLQTKFPQGCQVIYSYTKESEESEETRVRIGTVNSVFIDMMSSSRQLAYEINPIKSDTMIFIDEHLLAYAPQCPIFYFKTPREASALVRDEDQASEGIVLVSQWSNINQNEGGTLSYTILLQHSATDEHTMKTNVSSENVSYRSPTSRLLSTKRSGCQQEDLDPPSKRFKSQPEDKEACQIWVGNMNKQMSWGILLQHFDECGHVKFSEREVARDGKLKNCGIVRYATAQEAQHAIRKLNNMKIMGRTLLVKMDRKA